MRLSEAEIKAIEQRAKDATPGEWRRGIASEWQEVSVAFGPLIARVHGADDGNFIAASHQDIPRLVSDLRAALAVVEAANYVSATAFQGLMNKDNFIVAHKPMEQLRAALSAYEDGNGKV